MPKIQVNYEQAYQQARRLRQAAEESENACRQAERVLGQVQICWQGNAEKQFEEKLSAWIKDQQKIQQEMLELSRQIKKVTDDLKAAEEQVKAQINGSGGGLSSSGGGGGGGRGF